MYLVYAIYRFDLLVFWSKSCTQGKINKNYCKTKSKTTSSEPKKEHIVL